MELRDDREPQIDPEVRAFVFSLVSALGGSSAGDDGRYVLGDDALAVLKDIKRWLKLYDDKTNRLDVARLLAEANLVKGDLLEILAGWPEDSGEFSFRSKASLLCVDLLTQLTWPVEKDEEYQRMDHFMHIPYLQNAQAGYKRSILHHDTTHMLRTIVRVALPSIAQERNQRSPMEDNIIKVVLYLFRNIALIARAEYAPSDEDDSDTSRSATIDAFHRQDIFELILTLCSSMHEDFETHDVEIIDILFHLLKGIDVDRLFMEKDELLSSNTKELRNLIGKEKSMHAGYSRHAPSRHNRFDTMLWVKRDGGKTSTVFGQAALANEHLTMVAMDKSKTWKKPRRGARHPPENPANEFDTTVPITASARRHLRSFVERFLDSSFNPLFMSLRKSVEREAERVLESHTQQYFYLVAWFLRAETARRKKDATSRSEKSQRDIGDVESYSLVAAVLNQETFVLLNRFLQKDQDNKSWKALNAEMKCFTQILLTVHEMSMSPLDEDQDIAENILNRIFYEQTTHDRIIGLLRTYKDQGFGYLDAVTELSHVFLRLLEQYSKQNVDMQVRTRRRARKKKHDDLNVSGEGFDDGDPRTEASDIADAHLTSSERKFDFHRFSAKFVNQASVDTFVALLRFYKDLSVEQLKRCHRFFYRCAFKMEVAVYLFRMDIVALLQKMIKDPDGLNNDNPMFKEWEELSRQIFRSLGKKIEERPSLGVELLFSKIPSTMFFLEYGYDRELPKKIQKPPAELEVKPGVEIEEQLGVAVSILINQSKFDLITWAKDLLDSAAKERGSWEDQNEALRNVTETESHQAQAGGVSEDSLFPSETAPDNQNEDIDNQRQPQVPSTSLAPSIFLKPDTTERRLALQKDKYFRLLLALLQFETFGFSSSVDSTEATWLIPSYLTSTQLTASLTAIKNFEFNLPVYPEGKSAEDFVRRKVAPTSVDSNQETGKSYRLGQSGNETYSDSEGGSLPSDAELPLYPAGGPTIRPMSPSRKTKPRRHRNHHKQDELIDPALVEERRKARRKLEFERARKIKSALYVRDSDDESDEERDRLFFEKEGRERTDIEKKLVEEMRKSRHAKEGKSKKGTNGKRKSAVNVDTIDSDDEDSLSRKRTRLSSATASDTGSDSASGGNASDKDLPVPTTSSRKARNVGRKHKRPSRAPAAAAPSSSNPPSSSPPLNLAQDDSEADTDTDTPLSSQSSLSKTAANPLVSGMKGARIISVNDDEDDHSGVDFEMRDVGSDGDDDSDKENSGGVLPVRKDNAVSLSQPAKRNVRAGFVIESDDEDE